MKKRNNLYYDCSNIAVRSSMKTTKKIRPKISEEKNGLTLNPHFPTF